MNRYVIAGLVALCASTPSISAQGMELPKPGPEHELFKRWAGEFTYVQRFMPGPSMPMQEAKGTAIKKLDLNGFFLIDDIRGSIAGMEFKAHGVTGYDPQKKKYFSTWVDNFGPWMIVSEGTYDEKSKALTQHGQMPDPHGSGKMVGFRMVTTEVDADNFKIEWFQPGPEGKELRTMTVTYTRKK